MRYSWRGDFHVDQTVFEEIDARVLHSSLPAMQGQLDDCM